MAGKQSSGVSLLQRAKDLETEKRYTEALICYQEGLHQLFESMKECVDQNHRAALKTHIEFYMPIAEKLKRHVNALKEDGKFHEQVHIEAGSTGHSCEALFGPYMDESLTWVEVDDPYIRSHHQMLNFVRFCELLVKRKKTDAPCLLTLVTGIEANQRDFQTRSLKELQTDLRQYNVNLTVQFSDTLHDREIRLSNGWVIKSGRGLDIYKPTSGKFVIGACDFDRRPCHKTTVDIFHSKQLKDRKT